MNQDVYISESCLEALGDIINVDSKIAKTIFGLEYKENMALLELYGFYNRVGFEKWIKSDLITIN